MPPRSKPAGRRMKMAKPKPAVKPKSKKRRGKVQVLLGNCLDEMEKMGSMQYDLTFADPPFNIGQDYTGYEDTKEERDYHLFIGSAITQMAKVTKSILCLHGHDDLAVLYLKYMHRFRGFKRIAWINWHYRFGQCQRSNWIDSRCHLLVYSRQRKGYTWNPDEVLVDSDRVAQGDKRIAETENGGSRLPFTVWGVPSDGDNWGRIQGNNKERVSRRNGYSADHPNQLPEVYLERILRAYTNPGDLVLDPFAGTGTTATVAQALGRDCVTIDVSTANVNDITRRLDQGAQRV